MPTESYNIIRMAVNVSALNQSVVTASAAILNVLTGTAPAAYVATDIQFQIGLFTNFGSTGAYAAGVYADASPLDMSNVSSFSLDLKNPNQPGVFVSPSLFTGVVAAAGLTPVITTANWQAGTAQQVLVPMSSLQSNFQLQANQTWVLVMSGITTDSPARQLIYGVGPMNFWPTGLNTSGAPPNNSPSYYTTAQSDARYPVVVQEVTNGNGAAALGANCPAGALNQPGAWVLMTFSGPGGPLSLWVPGWTP